MSAKADKKTGQIFFVPHGCNLQTEVGAYINQQFQQQLPDLSHLTIIVPAPDLIYTLRRQLLTQFNQHGHSAFIGAEISPLKKWIEQNIPASHEQTRFINNHSRQLIILEALQQFPAHFANENLWKVSASLLQLFDELTLNTIDPSSLEFNKWQLKLKNLYQADDKALGLNREAELVYRLWQAWQQQLDDENLNDQSSLYIQRLTDAPLDSFSDQHFIFIGASSYSHNEIEFIRQLARHASVTLFLQTRVDDMAETSHPDHQLQTLVQQLDFDRSALRDTQPGHFDQVFRHDISLQQRQAERQNIEYPADNLKVFAAHSEEHEARAVELQIRRWLLEGKRNLAIVTENRKLARRVRALLERAGVNLVDSVGWSLSTTTAASVVERWLECIEQDFAAISFLDFLKSPFFIQQNDDLLQYIFRFEQDVIFHEKITANLQRYQQGLQHRQSRLEHWESNCYQSLDSLLSSLSNAATELRKLYTDNIRHRPEVFLQALQTCLINTGVTQALQQDEAGEQVLAEIAHMQQACANASPEMNWYDFRAWLGSAFEDHHYSPSTASSHVRLLNLAQSNSGHYDAVIIASCDAGQLPGSSPRTPFFNHRVRAALGLADWKQHKQQQYYLFRRLIQSAAQTLISYCSEKNNEPQLASPWLQTIIDYFSQFEENPLYPADLYQLLSSTQTTVQSTTHLLQPEVTVSAQPVIEAGDIPTEFSSSRHQRLINCPYQFFAADILKLRAPEELIEELKKSEYGQKVHRILELFHQQQKPDETETESLLRIEQISTDIFQSDIEDNFMHRGWLKRWLDHTRAYISWQQKREQQHWQFSQAESKHQAMLSENILLNGRIDRIDSRQQQTAIIDYKTSSKTPDQSEVETGEDIQLSSYALLLDNVHQVEYLKLDEQKGQVRTGARLEAEDLTEISQQVQQRFSDVVQQIRLQAPLVSNGNDEQCRYCDMSGLCRKAYWQLNPQ